MRSLSDGERQAATIAGLAYLLSFATLVAVNFGIFEPLVAHATPAEIARNILTHETQFRVGVAGLVLNCVGIMVVSAAFYVVLEPVNRMLALTAMLSRLVYGMTWLLLSLNSFTALRLLTQPEYRGFPADQLAVLARVQLSGHDAYYVGLLFWSLAVIIGAILWHRSQLVPRALAMFGAITGVWCAMCTMALYVVPRFADFVNLWLFDTPMVLYELALCSLLLFRNFYLSTGAAAPPRKLPRR